MEIHDLEPDVIIGWAEEYASYDELEEAAKKLYAVYKTRQKQEFPEDASRAKQYKKDMKNRAWGKKGKPRTENLPNGGKKVWTSPNSYSVYKKPAKQAF